MTTRDELCQDHQIYAFWSDTIYARQLSCDTFCHQDQKYSQKSHREIWTDYSRARKRIINYIDVYILPQCQSGGFFNFAKNAVYI